MKIGKKSYNNILGVGMLASASLIGSVIMTPLLFALISNTQKILNFKYTFDLFYEGLGYSLQERILENLNFSESQFEIIAIKLVRNNFFSLKDLNLTEEQMKIIDQMINKNNKAATVAHYTFLALGIVSFIPLLFAFSFALEFVGSRLENAKRSDQSSQAIQDGDTSLANIFLFKSLRYLNKESLKEIVETIKRL